MEKVEEYKTVQSECPVCGKAISSSPDMKKRSNKITMNMAAQGTKICIFFACRLFFLLVCVSCVVSCLHVGFPSLCNHFTCRCVLFEQLAYVSSKQQV